jgi:uncharacterized protein (DUF362 family)
MSWWSFGDALVVKMPSKVAVVKGERGHEPVFKALDLVDYRSAVAGFEKALIKVNFICEKAWDSGATTDPIVVEALWKKLSDVGVEACVVESDATITSADKAFVKSGMREMCLRNGIEFINLRHVKDKVKLAVPDGEALRSITVPRIVTDSAVISAAKLKTHSATSVTLGLKNMFGLLPDKFKGKYHMLGISNVVVDINAVLKPVLTVVDGFVGMEGDGPVDGHPVRMDLIVAGKDVVAVDATCCRVMGFDPHKVKHVLRARDRGLGEIDYVEVVGERVETVMRRFKPARKE